jgi:hypothetical protein
MRRLLPVLVAAAVLGVSASPAAAVLCAAKKGGRVSSRAKCNAKRELQLSLEGLAAPGPKGDPGTTGDPGATGDPGSPGGFRIVDANGAKVGPVFLPILAGTDTGIGALVESAAGPLLFFVTPEGFIEQSLEFLYTTADCTGERFLRHLGAGLFVRTAVVNGGTVYFADQPLEDRDITSISQDGGTTCGSAGAGSIRSGTVGSFPLSALGLTPPFQLTGP